ncbi:MAG: hypothetical protein HYY93_13685 [Planctomycetes bacterium]|nr:hypothetical protein [Planctomycetota bacterium]
MGSNRLRVVLASVVTVVWFAFGAPVRADLDDRFDADESQRERKLKGGMEMKADPATHMERAEDRREFLHYSTPLVGMLLENQDHMCEKCDVCPHPLQIFHEFFQIRVTDVDKWLFFNTYQKGAFTSWGTFSAAVGTEDWKDAVDVWGTFWVCYGYEDPESARITDKHKCGSMIKKHIDEEWTLCPTTEADPGGGSEYESETTKKTTEEESGSVDAHGGAKADSTGAKSVSGDATGTGHMGGSRKVDEVATTRYWSKGDFKFVWSRARPKVIERAPCGCGSDQPALAPPEDPTTPGGYTTKTLALTQLPPALCTANILVAEKERPFAVPTRFIGPEGKPVEVTEVLVVTETETTPVKRVDDKKFTGLLPPKPAKVIIAAGSTVLAVVSTLGTDGGSPGGSPAVPTGGAPTGGGVVAPPPTSPTEPARLVDVTRTPARPSPVVDLAPSTPAPSATPPTSSVPPKTAPVEPTFVRAQDEVQPLVAQGDFTPAKIDEYRAQVDYPQADLSAQPQVALMTEDEAVLLTDGTKEATGPAQVTIQGPEGEQTGAITSYGGRVVVSKEVVGTSETLVAKVMIQGLEPGTIVDWSIVLPPDGHFTASENAGGNTAGGRTSVSTLMAQSFPIAFDTAGPKQIPFYLEPVVLTPPPAAPREGK